MDILQALLKMFFGGGKTAQAPNPAPKPSPKPSAPAPAPKPAATTAPAAPAPHPQPAPAAPPAAAGHYLDGLRAASPKALTLEQFEKAAATIGCEPEALLAVVEVECGSGKPGFDSKGRPVILFEPHVFSSKTKHVYDKTHPKISYPKWKPGNYPPPDGVWDNLYAAYELDPVAALASTSWGRFQIMGFNHKICGIGSVQQFVETMAQSEESQLAAFLLFVKGAKLDDELAACDWAHFAAGYNGPRYAENKYDIKLAAAYDRYKKESAKRAKKAAKV